MRTALDKGEKAIYSFSRVLLTAVLAFPFCALLLSLPMLAVQYRKYGSFPAMRAVILYSFVLYLLCASFLVVLPLPSREAVDALNGPKWNLQPLAFLREFREQTPWRLENVTTWKTAVRRAEFIQPFFNLLLLLPLGTYMRYYFRISFFKSMALTFAVSLFFEATQLTGNWGYYSRPYRLFDIDDLLLNTLGGAVGWLAAPLLLAAFPSRREIDLEAYEGGASVSLIRRAAGLAIDWLIAAGAATMLAYAVAGTSLSRAFAPLFHPSIMLACSALYFLLLPLIFGGQTIGMRTVRIQIAAPSRAHLLMRQALFFLCAIPLFAPVALRPPAPFAAQEASAAWALWYGALLAFVLFAAHIAAAEWSGGRLLAYDRVAHCRFLSTIKPKRSSLR